MIRCILLLTVLLSFNSIASVSCTSYKELSYEQQELLRFSRSYGDPYDLGLTLAAIAWHESGVGTWRLNIHTKDLGLYQINFKTAENTLGVTSYYKRLALHQRLIYDDELAAYIAIKTLTYFKNFHKGSWRKMVIGYNKGHKKDAESIKKGIAYYNKIRYYVQILKTCS